MDKKLLGKQIGALVRQRRKAMKLTQEDLEAASGIPQGTISRIEREEAEDLHVSTLVGFAEALGMTPNEILGWEPSTKITAPKSTRAKTKVARAGRVPAGCGLCPDTSPMPPER